MAVPMKAGSLRALAFTDFYPVFAAQHEAYALCSVHCSASALERYYQSGNLEKPIANQATPRSEAAWPSTN